MSEVQLGVKTVKCPQCGGHAIFASTNAYRPFCSERCKNIDFGAWASEAFRAPVETLLDDLGLDATRHD